MDSVTRILDELLGFLLQLFTLIINFIISLLTLALHFVQTLVHSVS